MIPTRLELRQFLCYRDPVEVDFTGLRLACLCGENGAGKSALLDAITWALWEQARAGNTHLVSLGELETRVEFSFVLDGTEYRVVRGYTAAGRTRSLLELHVRRDDGWYPLASGGKQAVQREIDRLLGISYTTFVNSVFLPQGKADEFTRKTPAERKRILAELLELDRYERYRELARDEGKRLREERIRREQELELLRTRAAMVPVLQAQVRELDEVIRVRQERLTHHREHLAARQEHLQRLKLEVTRYRERQRQQSELTNQLERLREEEGRLAQDLERYQQFLRHEADIRQRAGELERIRRELDEIARIAVTREQLGDEIRRTERELEARRRELVAQLHAVETQRRQREQELRQQPVLEAERARLSRELERLAALRQEYQALCDRLSDLRTQQAELVTLGKQLRKELEDLAAQLARLDEIGAVCPVCLRPLSEEDRARQRAELFTKGQAVRKEFDSLGEEVNRLNAQVKELQRRQQELANALQREADLQAEIGRVTARLEQLEVVQQELARLERQHEELLWAQEHDVQIGVLAARLAELERQLAELPYDANRHAELQRRARELEPVQEELRMLEQARLTIQFGTQQLSQLAAQRATIEQQLAELQNELAQLPNPEAELVEAEQAVAAAQEAVAMAEAELHQAQAERGAARQRLEDAENAAAAAREIEAELERLAREHAVLEELEHAFGKHGIQTLILENVLPELADVTNEILDRLPGNTLRVDFTTQRDRASGDGAIETLDILISDEFGQRPYELYSGGEAFRINFALRVALSLLLAQRAGRRLETLVIDEGFGTQDAKGREGLVQALQAVQDRFALILVITHIEELKEQFPQRIEVYKTPAGSRVSIVI